MTDPELTKDELEPFAHLALRCDDDVGDICRAVVESNTSKEEEKQLIQDVNAEIAGRDLE